MSLVRTLLVAAVTLASLAILWSSVNSPFQYKHNTVRISPRKSRSGLSGAGTGGKTPSKEQQRNGETPACHTDLSNLSQVLQTPSHTDLSNLSQVLQTPTDQMLPMSGPIHSFMNEASTSLRDSLLSPECAARVMPGPDGIPRVNIEVEFHVYTHPGGPRIVARNTLAGLAALGIPWRFNALRESPEGTTPPEMVSFIQGPEPFDDEKVQAAAFSPDPAVRRRVLAGPNIDYEGRILKDVSSWGMEVSCESFSFLSPSVWSRDRSASQGERLGQGCLRDSGLYKTWPAGVNTRLFVPTLPWGEQRFSGVVMSYSKRGQSWKSMEDLVAAAGFKVVPFQYGEYTEAEFRSALAHCSFALIADLDETQGMAFVEMAAMDVPVLVKDTGQPSHPYLNPAIGELVRQDTAEKEHLDGFINRLADFQPRDWVVTTMSVETSVADLLRIACGEASTFNWSPAESYPTYVGIPLRPNTNAATLRRVLESIRSQTRFISVTRIVLGMSGGSFGEELTTLAKEFDAECVANPGGTAAPGISRNLIMKWVEDLNTKAILTFADADDIWHPQRLELVLGHFERRPNAVAILHDYEYQASRFEEVYRQIPMAVRCVPFGDVVRSGTTGSIRDAMASGPISLRILPSNSPYPRYNEQPNKEDQVYNRSILDRFGEASLWAVRAKLLCYKCDGKEDELIESGKAIRQELGY